MMVKLVETIRLATWSLLVAIYVFFFLALPASAAKITEQRSCILLSGIIKKGTSELLKAKLDQFGKALCLDSKGGSFSEGVRIAEHLSKSGIPSIIGPRSTCLSACAIAFMGGASSADDSRISNRTLHAGGRLGFHVPYLVVPEGNYNEAVVQKAYSAAMAGVGRLAEIMVQIKFRKQLLANMLKTKSSRFFEIDTVGKAIRFGITVDGIRPVGRINKTAVINACDNAYNSLEDETIIKSGDFFRVSEYSGPKVTVNGNVITVGSYPPEASTGCVLEWQRVDTGKGQELYWNAKFLESGDFSRGTVENVTQAYFFDPDTKLSKIAERQKH